MANLNELINCWGYGKQTDIVTANLVGAMWRLTNLNKKVWAQNPVAEDDAAEIGKGHEFATALYKSHYAPPEYEIQKYLSSEFAAWAFSFALGNVVKSGTGNLTYTITPILGSTNPTGLELPYFSFVQQIRPGGSAVLDQMLVGSAVRTLRLAIRNQPGRASAMLTAGLWTSGKYTEPSSITVPAATAMHEINAAGMTLTINGIDYVTTAKSFISLDWSWDNNFRSGFYPGSGSQDGFQIQGRAEIGDRAHGFTYVARYANGSTELTKLRALTTGTAVLVLSYDANNSLTITEQKLGFRAVELGDSDGIVTVAVTASPLYDSTNGLLTVVAKTTQDGICQ